MHSICAQTCQREWRTKHCYAVPENLPILCQNHDGKYRRYVRFNAREIPWSQNGTISGSAASATALQQFLPRQRRREEGQVADTAQRGTLDTRPSAEQVILRRSYWCDWAMETMTHIGMHNPHQECCQMSSIRHVNCQHEGCMAHVHQLCQHDWLQQHCYAVPTNLPIFCRNHTDSYTRWVRFTAGDIPQSQNGCIPGSVAATSEPRRPV
jgi:hypothetical protein